MVTVANPVYDTVFKYLMEDERIAAMRKLNMQSEDIANALGLDIKTVKLYS